MTRLERLKALYEKATPGPWCVETCGEKGDGSEMIGVAFNVSADPDCEKPLSDRLEPHDRDGKEIEYYRDEEVAECGHRTRNSPANAGLIIAMYNSLPALIAVAEAAENLTTGERDSSECVRAFDELVSALAKLQEEA